MKQTLRNSVFLLTLIAPLSWGKGLDTIMKSETIGVQKDYFEKIHGPAKRLLYGSTYQYQINSCKVNIEYDKSRSIYSVELEGISRKCNFDTKNIFLHGYADKLTYKDLISGAMDWQAKISCYTLCGNAADPSYGIFVQTPRVTQFIEFEANSDYSIAAGASNAVQDFFKRKYPNFEMIGDVLGPITLQEYNRVWMEKFKNTKLTSLKFGYQLKK